MSVQEPDRPRPLSPGDAAETAKNADAKVVQHPGLAPERRRERQEPWLRWAAILLAIFLAYQLVVVAGHLLERLLPVFLLVIFGALLAFLLAPLVNALERVGFGRTLAALTVYLAILIVVASGIGLLAGPATSQLASLVERYPEYSTQFQNGLSAVDAWLVQQGFPAPDAKDLVNALSTLLPQARSLVTGAVGIFAMIAGSVINLVLVFVIGFYLLRDGDQLRRRARQLLPAGLRSKYDFATEALAFVVGGYVRAQVIMAVIIGTLAGVGSWVLGVRYPTVIGLTVGLFELIPIFGALLGSLIAIFIALLQSVHLALLVIGYFLIIHFLEAYVLGPRITGVRVHLHPLVALLSMLVGVEVAGLIGALFAVPLAGLLNVFIRAFYWDIRAQNPKAFGASQPAMAASGWRRAWTQLRSYRAAKKVP